MGVRKAIAGSVSYKDLMKGGFSRTGCIFGKKELEEADLVLFGRTVVVEPKQIPTEKTKEMVKPLVLAVEDAKVRK